MVPSMRVRVIAVLVLLFFAAPLATGESITEADAVRLFLEQSPQARQAVLVERSVDAQWREAAQLSNPELGYSVEDAGGVRDVFLTVEQQLPLTGRRGLARETAVAAASAARFAADRELAVAVAELRTSFHEALYREAALDRIRQGVRRLERIVEILVAREREGEASGYDVLRAEQELAEIEVSVSDAQAATAVARARFGAFFDPEREIGNATLDGDFVPDGTAPDEGSAVASALAQRTDLQSLRSRAQRLELDHRAAKRSRFPEPTLTAGWKRTESVGLDDSGFVAAVTLPMPLFDRGQHRAAQARVDRERNDLRAEILEREIRAEVRAALAREKAARESLRRQGDDVEQRAAELRRIANLAYDEGEAGILELLDAYSSSLATELRALAVRYRAKHAEIERERAIGIEVQP